MLSCIYMYRINEYNSKISLLLESNQKIFHTQDLGIIWGISNKNTLYKTVQRYIANNTLKPIYKGMYSTAQVSQLNPWEMGIKAIHSYAYISCETILFQNGYINQPSQCISLISAKSKQFQINNHVFKSRQLKDEFLYNDIGVIQDNNVHVATSNRAIVDMLYFNSRTHFDITPNWKDIRQLQKSIGYPITDRS